MHTGLLVDRRMTSDRLRTAHTRDNETPEQTDDKRTSDRLRAARTRDNETPEQTDDRRTADRLRTKETRDNGYKEFLHELWPFFNIENPKLCHGIHPSLCGHPLVQKYYWVILNALCPT